MAAAMIQDFLLDVNDLKTQFRNDGGFTDVVSGVSFSLKRGEIMALVGESGSGKSITSLSLMGLLPAGLARVFSGSANYIAKDGRITDLLGLGPDALRGIRGKEIAMIFQEPMTSLNPVMRCGHQVTEAIREHLGLKKDEARKRTIELFDQVKLPEPSMVFDKYPHQLSGGQKQRVMIAMALSCDPRILIADEPTTALDVTVQKAILELLRSIRNQTGIGIIFITHDLGVVSEIADSVTVMYKGRIVEQGPVQQVLGSPAHPYTKSLIACRPPLSQRPSRLPVVSDFVRALPDGSFVSNPEPPQISFVSLEERRSRQMELNKREKLLSLENISTWFPSGRGFLGGVQSYTRAVDEVSLDVFEGETLGLVGESGCGKTTLGRTVLKLALLRQGRIMYRGQDITSMKEKEFRELRREMQIVFQDPYSSLNPRITIGNAIAEPMGVHGIVKSAGKRRDRVMELLGKVGLDEGQYNRYPHEFSGGQRQRICIARTLAMQPRFVICDESVSALDVSVQAQVLNLLNDLKCEFRLTYIFISHDLSVVKYMSDRMIVMKKGRIVESGDPDKLYSDPASEYTRQLIGSIPKVIRTPDNTSFVN